MHLLTLYLAQAAPSGGSGWMNIVMIILMIAIFYFFMIRPQSKRQKELQQAREAMKTGDQVITSGGLYGVIKNIDAAKGQVQIEIADGIRVKVDQSHIFPAEKSTEKK